MGAMHHNGERMLLHIKYHGFFFLGGHLLQQIGGALEGYPILTHIIQVDAIQILLLFLQDMLQMSFEQGIDALVGFELYLL